ncbi:MAG: hypothetical protein LBJ00_00165 [Planctomycetaceae bacterium]|nr:hypothetical protein [Planctomycetaceae bacterium]
MSISLYVLPANTRNKRSRDRSLYFAVFACLGNFFCRREFFKILFAKNKLFKFVRFYTQAVLKFQSLNTQAQQRKAVVQGRSLPATV